MRGGAGVSNFFTMNPNLKCFFLCSRDDSQGALTFAPVCPSVCLSIYPSVCPFVRHALRNRVCVILLLPQFLVDLFETLHTCCGHIEDVHVSFWWS